MTEAVFIHSTSQPWLMTRADAFLRRFIDIVFSLAALVVLSPIFLWIALALRRDSPGPTFYRGLRCGLRGKPFRILKFRTMYETPQSYAGAKITGHGDPRVTPFGAWLRDTKLNELPQLWNVLKGEMSLVGPRPEDPTIVAEWPAEVREQLLSVRPGITSPASVFYRDEEALMRAATVMEDYLSSILPTKLRLDLLYVRNRTIITDLDVIFWTLVVLLPKLRQRPIAEHLLYWGPLSVLVSRYLSWLMLDFLTAFIAVSLSGVIWRSTGPLELGLAKAFLVALGYALIFSATNWLLGMNRIEWSRAPAVDSLGILFSSLLATLVVAFINHNFLTVRLPLGLILVAGLLAFVGFVSIRYRDRVLTGLATRWLRLRGGARDIGERVLVVGAGENGALVSWLFSRNSLAEAFHIVGMVDDDPRKQGMRVEGHPILGTTAQIPELVQKLDVGLIIYTIDNINPQERQRILATCYQTPSHVVLLPDAIRPLRAQLHLARRSNSAALNADTLPLQRGKPSQWDSVLAERPQSLASRPQLNPSQPEQVNQAHLWLEELNGMAEMEDWVSLKRRLSEMRLSLRSPADLDQRKDRNSD